MYTTSQKYIVGLGRDVILAGSLHKQLTQADICRTFLEKTPPSFLMALSLFLLSNSTFYYRNIVGAVFSLRWRMHKVLSNNQRN
jgi:hypothetical protein